MLATPSARSSTLSRRVRPTRSALAPSVLMWPPALFARALSKRCSRFVPCLRRRALSTNPMSFLGVACSDDLKRRWRFSKIARISLA